MTFIQHKHKKPQGMAIITVMVIILVLTVSVFLLARNTQFVSKLAGFFKRSQQLEEAAESGIVMARTDLSRLLTNSQLDGNDDLDSFIQITGESNPLVAAYDQGVFFNHNNSLDERVLTPRIQRTSGDIQTQIFYFPENPCIGSTCADNDAYNKKLPKYFLVISEATQQSTGEVFTIESRIQVRMENFAEISLGFHGVGSFPPADQNFVFFPGVYGRTHINLPADKVVFKFAKNIEYSQAYTEDSRNRFWFMDPVTFHEKTPSGQDHPYTVQSRTSNWITDPNNSAIAQQHEITPFLEFEAGYKDDVKLGEGSDNFTSPTSPAYIQSLKDSYGASTITADCTTATGSGTQRYVDKCYKLNGDQVLEYNCNVNDSGMMGRIDDPVLFWISPALQNKYLGSAPQNIKEKLTNFVLKNYTDDPNPHDPDSSTAPISYVVDKLGMNHTSTDNPIDRYKGEWADRLGLSGTPNHIGTMDSSGIYVCEGSDSSCKCRTHIKGILKGQLTMVSDVVVIEGDLVYQDQSPTTSTDILGLIAKEQVEIPEGIPQGVDLVGPNPAGTFQTSTDKFHPFDSGNPAIMTPAEAYLGITNFIPQNENGVYEDRDINDIRYAEHATFWNREYSGIYDAPIRETFQAYNAVNALDIDAHIYSPGPLVVQGIFNPEVSDTGIGILTCENADCTETKRRDPFTTNDPEVSFFKEETAYFAYDDITGDIKLGPQGEKRVFTYDSPVPQGFTVDFYVPAPASYKAYTPITNSDGHEIYPLYYANGMGRNGPGMSFSNWDYGSYAGKDENGVDLPQGVWINGPDNSKYYDASTDGRGEVVPRSSSSVLSVFGGINTQYFYSQQTYNEKGFGFATKILKNDPRSFFLVPPGFPPTNLTLTEELFRKAYMGRSKLLL